MKKLKIIYLFNLKNKICICDIISDNNSRWTYDEINEEQYCLYSCSDDKYENKSDPITNKCLDKCDPSFDNLYNGKCYKNGCPSGTKLAEDGPEIIFIIIYIIMKMGK